MNSEPKLTQESGSSIAPDTDKVEINEMTPERLLNFKREGGELSDLPALPFILRRFCPDAVSIMTGQVRIPMSYRKHLAEVLGGELDLSNDHQFYSRVLDLLEHDPTQLLWMLDSIRQNEKQKNGKSVFDSTKFAITKLANKTGRSLDILAKKVLDHDEAIDTSRLSRGEMVGLFFLYAQEVSNSTRRAFEEADLQDGDTSKGSGDQQYLSSKLGDDSETALRMMLDPSTITGSKKEQTVFARALGNFAKELEVNSDPRLVSGVNALSDALSAWSQEHNDNFTARLVDNFGIEFENFVPNEKSRTKLEELLRVVESTKSRIEELGLRKKPILEKAKRSASDQDHQGAGELYTSVGKIDKEIRKLDKKARKAVRTAKALVSSDPDPEAPKGKSVSSPTKERNEDSKSTSGGESRSSETTKSDVAQGQAEQAAQSSEEDESESPVDQPNAETGISVVDDSGQSRTNAEAEDIEGQSATPGGDTPDQTHGTTLVQDDDEFRQREIFSHLLNDDRLAIAERYAASLEQLGQTPALPRCSLELAARARISFKEYDSSTSDVAALMNIAQQENSASPEASILLFGALMRPAILQRDTRARSTIGQLSFGSYSATISGLSKAISDLDLGFSPSLSDLARVSGRSVQELSSGLLDSIKNWQSSILNRRAPCLTSTRFLQSLVTDGGDLARAIHLAQRNSSRVNRHSIRKIVRKYDGPELINQELLQYSASNRKRTRADIDRTSLNYVTRHVGEGVSSLNEWLTAVELESKVELTSHGTVKIQVENLISRSEDAIKRIAEAGEVSGDPLRSSLFNWLNGRIRDLIGMLNGTMPEVFEDSSSATRDEYRLLPFHMDDPEIKRNNSKAPSKRLVQYLIGNRVPDIETAIKNHAKRGDYRRAAQLLANVRDTNRCAKLAKLVDRGRRNRTGNAKTEIDNSIRSLEEIERFSIEQPADIRKEVKHLQAISDVLEQDLETNLLGLAAAKPTDLPSSLDEVSETLKQTKQVVTAEKNRIRENQAKRLENEKEKKAKRKKEIDELISSLNEMSLGFAEDQIANIRDDRPVGHVSVVEKGPFEDFFPGFVEAASKDDWPQNGIQYGLAFAGNGALEIQADRHDAAIELINSWHSMAGNLERGQQPTVSQTRDFLQALTFRDVHPGKTKRVGRIRAWERTVAMNVGPRDWFCPPIFGSRACSEYRIVFMHRSVLLEQVQEVLAQGSPYLICVAERMSVSKRREFATRLRQSGISALLIDEVLTAFVATRSEERLSVLFDCGLPFGRIEPYITDAGKLPPEMFFGREKQIEKIVRRDSDGVLVYGGRQLGKSAMLAHIEQTMHDEERGKIVIYEDIKVIGSSARSADEVWHILADRLNSYGIVEKSAAKERVADAIEEWIKQGSDRQILVLLDETDKFMACEAKSDFPNILRLKQLMETTDRRFKSVFAGLHHVQRMYRSPNSPLAHFGSEVCVGPLNTCQEDREAALKLVVEPMRAAGFKFENSHVQENILSYLNHYPSLVQVYGKELVQQLNSRKREEREGPLWTIPNDVLRKGEAFTSIEASIRKRFSYTLDLDPRYKLIAYVLGLLRSVGRVKEVLVDGLPARAIVEEAREYWPEQLEGLSYADMQIILDEMFELGVLGKFEHDGKHPTYCLRTMLVANMLGSDEDILDELHKLDQAEPPLEYNPSTNRRYWGRRTNITAERDARNFSVLTDSQLSRLFSADNSGAGYVTGTGLLGFKRVPKSLEKFADLLNNQTVQQRYTVYVCKSERAFLKATRTPRSNRSVTNLIVYAPTEEDIQRVLGYIDKQTSLLGRRGVRPILLFDADQAVLRDFAVHRQAETLRPWGTEMLRSFLELVEEEPHLDRASTRDMILEKTGGLPDQVIALVKMLRGTDNPDTLLKEYNPDHEISRELANVEFRSVVSSICSAMEVGDEDEISSEIYELLDEDMRSEFGFDLESIGPDLLTLGLLDHFDSKRKAVSVSRLGKFVGDAVKRSQSQGGSTE